MASTARTRKSRGESSTSPSGTSDSTSTTMFVVNQAEFTTTTSEDSSSRQVVQGSSSEVEVNLQQGPTVSGFPSQPVPGPSGYNVFLPIGPSVPVIFTEQGIRIPGYNAPAAVPGAEDDGTTSSTTATEQQEAQDAPVAGIFQLLPAGSYLPTFVNMEQLEEEDEERDENEELPLELDQEEEPLEEPVQPPIVGVVGASIREQEMFFQMPLQREASPAAWPQAVVMPPQMVPPMMSAPMLSPPMMSPPMMSPPMMSPPMMPPPMYSHMQAAQMYASPQYGMPSPLMSFGWQAQMLQGQEQVQAYGQPLGMEPQPPQTQWPAFQTQWAGTQWQLGQPQWPQGQCIQGGPQVTQQQQTAQQVLTQEVQEFVASSETDQAVIRVAEKRVRSVSTVPRHFSDEEFLSQGAPLNETELLAPSSQAPCLDHRVLKTRTSVQHVAGPSEPIAAESSTRIDICRKGDKYDVSQAAHVSVSSGHLATEATQVTQVTHGTEACPTMQDLQPKKVVLEINDARMQAEDPCMTFGMQTSQEFMGSRVTSGLRDTERIHRPAGTQPAKVFSDPQHPTLGTQAAEKPLGPSHIALGIHTVEQFTQPPSRAVGLQVAQKHAELPHAADGAHVTRGCEEALRPTVGVQIIPQPAGPPHITLEVQGTGQPASDPHSLVTGTQALQEHGEPPCMTFGMQTAERLEPRTVTGIAAVQQRILSPQAVSAVHAADMHIKSLQKNLQVQCPEQPQVSQSVQATSVINIPGITYVDSAQISRSPAQAHMPGGPFRHTVRQAVQASSVDSVTLLAQHGPRTMVSVEQLQVDMGAHSHAASMTVGSGPQRQQQDIGVQHGGIIQPILASRPPSPARKHRDLEIQCNYEQPMQTARSITAIGIQQKYESSGRHQTDFGIQCTFQPRDRIVKTITTLPPRPLHDAEVQFGDEPIKEPPPEPPSHDFGVQCVYEPDHMMERDISRAGSRPMHGFMELGYGQAKWNEKGLFPAGGRSMRNFEGQYDRPVTMSPLPMTPQVLHETVAIGVGDGGPKNMFHANYRFNQGLMSRVQSGLSVSSSLSSLFMFGRSHLPVMTNAATQVAEMERSPLSPMFASPVPKVETAAYPCVAVCSRNTVNHACTLNVSSYPGRLSQTPQMRDAVFQIGEPFPAMPPFGQQLRSQSLSKEPDGRTPFREAAIQTFAMSAVPPASSPPLSPPSSPYQLGPFGTSAGGSTPRSGSPTRDAGLQTEGGFTNLRESPLGGLFRHESVAQLAEPAGGPTHDIMIQADTLTPNAGNAWGPWQVQRRTPVAATAEVYPCGHLPQVLQTRDVPPSPPPLSPPPHSPYPGAQGWQLPVVVEHKVGIGGDLLRLLTLRQQQQNLPPDERPGQAEKGVSEGPFAGPAWGSTDGEQDYADQGSSQVEQSSGAGEYLPAGAVLGAAGLAAEAEAAAKTARRSSIETTSNLTRSTKVASILPEVTVACFLLALLLVLVASAALLSWTTRRHARVVLIGQTTKKALHPSNATYIIPPFSVTPADRPLQTINPSLSGNFTTEHTGSPTGPRTYELCATDFCVKEGQMLRYLRDSATDPCKNFYEYVCGQWLSQQPSDVTYLDVDGALATDIEARMHRFLDGPEKSSIRPLFTFWTNCNRQGATAQDRAISHARALGLELPGSQASASPERLMVLAVTLAQEFGLFALLTVELDVDPEGKDQHVLAVDEPELAWGRMKPPLVTSDHTVYWAMLTRAAQPLAALLLTDSRAVQSATHNFARITMVMTNASVAHRHLSDRMGHYRMRGYRELSRLDPHSSSTACLGAPTICGRLQGCWSRHHVSSSSSTCSCPRKGKLCTSTWSCWPYCI
ncbi:uncharacterized protein LOC144132941 isoform X2 [Amblyomma americanum]